jgi:hypothetical protein
MVEPGFDAIRPVPDPLRWCDRSYARVAGVATVAYAGAVTQARWAARVVGALALLGGCAETAPQAATSDAAPVARSFAVPTAEPHTLFTMGSVEIVVHPDAVMIGDVRIAAVGRDGVEGAVHHRVATLDTYLAALDAGIPIAVRAHRDAPHGAVVDVLFATMRAHRRDVLVAVQGRVPGAIAIHGGALWDRSYDERQRDASCLTTARLVDTHIQVEPCIGEPAEVEKDDRAALQAIGAHVDKSGVERHVLVLAPASARWATVVDVIDAIGSDGCKGPDEPPSDTCRRWTTGVDLSPPMPWYAGDWDALDVSIFDVDTAPSPVRTPRYTQAELRTRVDGLLPQLRECLRESVGLRIRMPRCVSVMLAHDDRGREVSFVWEPGAPACLSHAFAPSAEHPQELVPGDAQIRLAIEIPTPSGADASPECAVRRRIE